MARKASAMTPSPNIGQKKSSYREPGSASRAITGRNVAVMM
jgi:hypothetical protein